MGQPVVVLDGDDTLWFVEPLYDEARAAAAAVVAAAGLDPRQWEALQRRLDVRYVASLGVSPKRFPESCAEAYGRLAARSTSINSTVEASVRAAANSVFLRTAVPVDDVRNIVGRLREAFHVILLTKGDEKVQNKRILDAGLTDAFDLVAIVPDKGIPQFREVLSAMHADASSAWSVGNSLASDINPALRIGMHAIWVDAHVWEYEQREREIGPGDSIKAPDLSSAAQILLEYRFTDSTSSVSSAIDR